MLGPAFETFAGAILALLVVAVALVWAFRKPAARLYNRLREVDRKELAEVLAREQECLKEEEARKKAMQEIERDCYPAPESEKHQNLAHEASKQTVEVNQARKQ